MRVGGQIPPEWCPRVPNQHSIVRPIFGTAASENLPASAHPARLRHRRASEAQGCQLLAWAQGCKCVPVLRQKTLAHGCIFFSPPKKEEEVLFPLGFPLKPQRKGTLNTVRMRERNQSNQWFSGDGWPNHTQAGTDEDSDCHTVTVASEHSTHCNAVHCIAMHTWYHAQFYCRHCADPRYIAHIWVWLKIKELGLHKFCLSIYQGGRFACHVFEPQP